MNLTEYFNTLRTGDYQIDNFRDFLRHFGFKYNIPSIHIAGTNGKGSTANYISSIYAEAGYKVGLFTSPFLLKENEMIRINSECISDADFERIIKENEKAINKFNLSAFEVQTFVCLTYFNEQKCDIGVIECGMGGELDATNVFESIVSVITSVGIEHTAYLGRTASEIAYHKAGIIPSKSVVIVGDLPDDATKVIIDVANRLQTKVIKKVDASNPVLTSTGYTFSYLTYKDVKIQSVALYSVTDACLALETIKTLQDKFPVNDETIKAGLFKVEMPCRMDIVNENPLIIIDGAHNPEGMLFLKNSLQTLLIGKKIRTVFACFKDKNIQNMLASIGEISDELVLTTFNNPRARNIDDYFLFGDDYKFIENPLDAVKYYIENYPTDTILITGSLAFAAYMKSLKEQGDF